jgi:HlyD family secretion protein
MACSPNAPGLGGPGRPKPTTRLSFMKPSESISLRNSRTGRTRGLAYRGLLLAIPVVLAVPLAVRLGLPQLSRSSEEDGPEMHVVHRGTFTHDVTENGSIDSANNVEIRCEVESHGGGAMILWIIPEGTYVEPAPDWKPTTPDEEPPDLLVKLDSSSLEDNKIQQQLKCNSSEALLTQAKNILETATIALQEYVEGTYQEAVQGIEGSTLLAESSLARSRQYLEDSKLLHAKGFMSDRELESDAFAVAQQEIALEELHTRMQVLEKFSRPKVLLDREADIKIAQARFETQQHSYQLDIERLAEAEEQIEKCTIRAPQAGQVVYANVSDHHGRQQIVIEEGTMVRERQAIIKLPDSKNMQVKAKINEARVSRVQVGMAATIQLDAFADLDPLGGEVEKVDEYPQPTGWWMGDVKEYETIIKINAFPDDVDMRPGMTAQVKIRVERLNDVLLVPVQAVVEHGGKHYCALGDGDDAWQAREVVIGSTNDEEVVIVAGLTEGDKVLHDAAFHRDKLNLPARSPEPQPPSPSSESPLESTQAKQSEGDVEKALPPTGT